MADRVRFEARGRGRGRGGCTSPGRSSVDGSGGPSTCSWLTCCMRHVTTHTRVTPPPPSHQLLLLLLQPLEEGVRRRRLVGHVAQAAAFKRCFVGVEVGCCCCCCCLLHAGDGGANGSERA